MERSSVTVPKPPRRNVIRIKVGGNSARPEQFLVFLPSRGKLFTILGGPLGDTLVFVACPGVPLVTRRKRGEGGGLRIEGSSRGGDAGVWFIVHRVAMFKSSRSSAGRWSDLTPRRTPGR